MTGLLLVVALFHPPSAYPQGLSLPEGADTNDWNSYHRQGLREIDRHPARAFQYFTRAAQLDPSVAEPLLGRYAAWWRMHGSLKNRFWHDKPSLTDSALATERWLDDADLRNPFASQGVLTWTAPKRVVLDPHHPFNRGLVDFFGDDWLASVPEFTAAINHPEGLVELLAAYRFRSLSLAHIGRWSSAADDIDQMISLLEGLEANATIRWDLGKARLYYTAALMRMFSGDQSKAREAFERAFESDLGFPMAHVYFGNLLLDQRDTVAGIREYAMAVELRPTDPFIQQNYGAVLFNLGRYDSALTHLSEAIRLAPEYAILYFNRAICLEQLGRTDEARSMHREFVARAPRRMKPLIQQSESFLQRSP